ncbi:hypothetical protein CYLTODRAFT_495162 [Cylindrobasidium torrendii FP15055 ss-10]|uniref:Uncharacterized protein n=1 Tax=Cylindrobasidium torrendii FP15055 ss-10 TaxID=1314674 RepID=A0A0D7AUE2_9AGAR|nr:hypothetical protein CYLTODRAFT_495162 [Cylindrobasidium torrendii FP15055 ss-10]
MAYPNMNTFSPDDFPLFTHAESDERSPSPGSDSMDIDSPSLVMENLARDLERYLCEDICPSSEDEDGYEASDRSSASEASLNDRESLAAIVLDNVRTRRSVTTNAENEWFPWPDKQTCVLDILRHIPRCAFSRKSNSAIHWAMKCLGIRNLPSDRQMDDIDRALQEVCGISTTMYRGKLGHVYYMNSLGGIISQEMSNPRVRRNLHFFPEDLGGAVSEAWHGRRWSEELDPSLATQMIVEPNSGHQYYVHEPTMLKDGQVFMPIRWFRRQNQFYCSGFLMSAETDGWIIEGAFPLDVAAHDLLFPMPDLVKIHSSHGLPDPRMINGIRQNDSVQPWTVATTDGFNVWRARAKGRRVVSFPIWLYCDDTSGNMSKRWNKHNSFLFTAAGLPRREVHKESNIHFLCTSNIAPPLEMLDGVVEQLEDGQNNGIWAWDAQYHEPILVLPFVLAMTGDNPMQSEFACHIGFTGRLFCRVCKVSGLGDEEEEPDYGDTAPGTGNDSDAASHTSDQSRPSSPGTTRPRKGKKNGETMGEMVNRITNFMTANHEHRTPAATKEELRSQFSTASTIGGISRWKQERTATGTKDTFQHYFIEKMLSLIRQKKVSPAQRQRNVDEYKKSLPDDFTLSPVWRIKDFNPHTDTPVEILHVVLLGYVKYLWRDAVARLKTAKDNRLHVLKTRLDSLDISGLGVDKLRGETLVTYAGSLQGGDFRKIAQVAPFVLYDLMPSENIEVWTALGHLAALLWQPEIPNITSHIEQLEAAIDHFLNCVCRLSPQWFNKPKFHVLLHLPTHVVRFGPAILFATEGFESFNAIIRAASVHSPRSAPSKDIASRMARASRVRHLIHGGYIRVTSPSEHEVWQTTRTQWSAAGVSPLSLLEIDDFGPKLWSLSTVSSVPSRCGAVVSELSKVKSIHETLSFYFLHENLGYTGRMCRTSAGAIASNGDICLSSGWIIYQTPYGRQVARVLEFVQLSNSPMQREDKVDWALVQLAQVGQLHSAYGMPTVVLSNTVNRVGLQDICCSVNVQHNCFEGQCVLGEGNAVREERQETIKRKPTVKHSHLNSYILNTTQMRDAKVLASFRIAPMPLVRSNVIHTAVKSIFDGIKQSRAEEGSLIDKPVGRKRQAASTPMAQSVDLRRQALRK